MSDRPPAPPGVTATPRAALTPGDIQAMRNRGEPIVMITAYDYPSAVAAERAAVDIVLVGDSAATTVLGLASTREVRLDEMLMLTRAVRRGLASPLLVGDMPFGTYEDSSERAVATARAFVDAGCAVVKLEGAGGMLERVGAIVAAGIPVMGHVGLLPQSATSREEYRARGRTADEAHAIVRDAVALEQAGCFAIVIEAVPPVVASAVTSRVRVPTIGIGAGSSVDGQVLVWHDLLGLLDGPSPRFVRRFAELRSAMITGIGEYAAEVRARRYPAVEHTYGMAADEERKFERLMEDM